MAGACWSARSTAPPCRCPTAPRTWPSTAGRPARTAVRDIRCYACSRSWPAVPAPSSTRSSARSASARPATRHGCSAACDRACCFWPTANFAVKDLIEQIHTAGADLLIRCKANRNLPAIKRCPDGSWLTRLGTVTVRVIDAEINVTTAGQPHHTGRYRLITTLTDHRAFPALDLVALYHQRWEIETAFLELKSTTLHGRVLRARTPAGIDQEVYALLTTYQTLRLAMTSATDTDPDTNPDRASFTIALNTARDQIIHAASVIAGTVIDLIGAIGRAVLNDLLPNRRIRISPRVVKRAISKHRAKGPIDRTNHPAATTTITAQLTTSPEP